MKLHLLSLIFASFLLVLSIANIAVSSDDDFYPGDDAGGSVGGGSTPSDDDFYSGYDGGGSPSDDDFYPPANDDDFYPPSDDGSSDSGGDGGGAAGPVPVSNNPPVISVFSVPAAAGRNTDITLSVVASDGDGGVSRIEILRADGTVIASDSCGNAISCAKSFIVRVPDAFSAVYTFVARVFDGLGAAATASGSGRTNPAPAAPAPAVVPAPQAPRGREHVGVSIPSDEIFISSLVPDTGCLAPGDETFLYISLKNTGKRMLDDIKVTAIVPDSEIRAVSGPFSIRKGDSASRFLYFAVPESARPGDYYIKVAVTFGKDSVVKYRNFEVSRAC